MRKKRTKVEKLNSKIIEGSEFAARFGVYSIHIHTSIHANCHFLDCLEQKHLLSLSNKIYLWLNVLMLYCTLEGDDGPSAVTIGKRKGSMGVNETAKTSILNYEGGRILVDT